MAGNKKYFALKSFRIGAGQEQTRLKIGDPVSLDPQEDAAAIKHYEASGMIGAEKPAVCTPELVDPTSGGKRVRAKPKETKPAAPAETK